MTIHNTITNTYPFFFHAQGKDHKVQKWYDLVNDIVPYTKGIIFPDQDKVTVITFKYGSMGSSFDRQMDKGKIKYVNLAEKYEHKGVWQNKYKILYTAKFLQGVTTPYVMISDAFDVLGIDNWTGIIEKFHNFNFDILFGAMSVCYPFSIEDVEDKNSKWKYLSAGNVIGKTEALKVFYREVSKACETENSKLVNNEQGIVRKVRRQFNNIKCDTNCELFVTCMGFEYQFKDNVITVYEK